jgi:hypothetical protein
VDTRRLGRTAGSELDSGRASVVSPVW